VSGNDYLWDGTGDPDPQVQRLEALLRPLRSTRPAPGLGPTSERLEARPGTPRVLGWQGLAAAAVLVIAVVATWSWSRAARDGWSLQYLEGASWADARVVGEARLGLGEWIDTRTGRVRLAVGEIGEVQLEPSTRVKLVDEGRASHRLALDRGVMHALIWAPPGQFVVDTPSATAVDLGCSYTLRVAEDGSGLLRVEAGWVGFEHQGRRSLVPADAEAVVRRGRGPGTPYFSDVSPAFVAALQVADFGDTSEARARALDTVLAGARARDALSLWHLLARTHGSERGRVHDRLAELVPPPPGVTREGLLGGDRAMLDAWWNELGLGPAEAWREWTSPFHEPSR